MAVAPASPIGPARSTRLPAGPVHPEATEAAEDEGVTAMSRNRTAWWSDAITTALIGALPMALLLAALLAAVSMRPEPQTSPVAVTYTACGPDGAYVNVTNPGATSVLVGFNADPPSVIEPGGSVGAGITRGAMRVVVDGEPVGAPYEPAPSDCLA